MQNYAGGDAQIVLEARGIGHAIEAREQVVGFQDPNRDQRCDSGVESPAKNQGEAVFTGGEPVQVAADTGAADEELRKRGTPKRFV